MKKIEYAILFLFVINTMTGQVFHRMINEQSIVTNRDVQKVIKPISFSVAEFQTELLKSHLYTAPSESRYLKSRQTLNLSLPNPDGEETVFKIYEYPIMQSNLASKYRDIRVFKGYNPSNPFQSIVMGISSKGFYATVRQPGSSYSIDKYALHSDRYYQVYYHDDLMEEAGINSCGVEAGAMDDRYQSNIETRSNSEILDLQIYRVAISATGEFSAKFGPSKEEVLASIVQSLARVNQIYENDLSIRLILVDNNDELIFLNRDTDPFPEGNRGGALLSINTGVISDRIGFANYDIGHVYTGGCSDVGGIASLSSVCGGTKGNGVSCFSSSDITSSSVRIVAHEMGHQFGAPHTFNNCNGNESSGTAYEPGSGSTIMSYGGLCGSDLNVVSASDDYYHINSLLRIKEFMRDGFGSNCATSIETGNHFPEIQLEYEDDFFIPISTPFELEGYATDEDGDTMTYVWEEYDLGPSTILGEPVANSPLFRSVYPSLSPKRVFPNIQTIINNDFDRNEVLPSYERDLSFQFVVRDNHFANGAVSWEKISFNVTENAGPFLVTYPNQQDTFKVGEEIEVTWDVANTTNKQVNCQSVDIYLSTDGGYNYDQLLLEKTANDGSAFVFIPNIISEQARIKIKASENIFFDISDFDFVIEEPTVPGFTGNLKPGYLSGCVPEILNFEFETDALLGFQEELKIEIANEIPEGMEISFNRTNIEPGQKALGSVSFNDDRVSGLIKINITASSNSDTIHRTLVLDLTSSNFDDIEPLTPNIGSSGNSVSPGFTWSRDIDAESYIFSISDNPAFDGTGYYYELITTDTFAILKDILEKSNIYYWKVDAENECGIYRNEAVYTFATEALSCNTFNYTDVPTGITQSVARTIELPIEVFSSGEVSDVNIKKLRGSHTWVSELKGELISPTGTSIVLFSNKCGNQADFNCGFDDDAPIEINCPLNQGLTFKPQMALDTFIGESIQGTWQLNLSDTEAGNGGTLQEYVLELCSNAVLENPELVNNNVMPLPSGLGRRISADFLLAEDPNNGPDELIYTIVILPRSGSLVRNGDTLGVGDQFSQSEIFDQVIGYRHGGESENDQFLFTVQDGEGGWIELTAFEIVIDNDVVLDVSDEAYYNFKISPNPSGGVTKFTFDSDYSGNMLEIFDVKGLRVYHTGVNKQIIEVDLSFLPAGIYFGGIPGKHMKSFIIQSE